MNRFVAEVGPFAVVAHLERRIPRSARGYALIFIGPAHAGGFLIHAFRGRCSLVRAVRALAEATPTVRDADPGT
jgi:hypothetical protein